jgi:TatD DNase family protein
VTTPYINLHTHHLPKEDGVFLFNNRFGVDEDIYTGKYFSAGIHPWDAGRQIPMSELEQLVSHTNCLAIGECGLDKLKGPDIAVQKKVFEAQLELAQQYQKPVIIHCVKAFDELIEICIPYMNKIPLIIHGFNKSEQLAAQLIHKGFCLSLQSSLFSKNDFNFNALPLESIFLETDTNAHLLMSEVYQKAALAFNQSEHKLKEKIYSNFTALFKHYGR